ncbi:MAG: hypothetical protein HY851_07150 [candidate division Zixibacteria bacterium]|nr:hypothetical protein [candidate division Zixibacteria bacterium]
MAKTHKSSKPRSGDALTRIESSRWFTPIGFLIVFLALVVMFGSFIFSDMMLHGSDTLSAGFFFRSLWVDSITHTGGLPQWNPYIFGGMPYIEAFHGDIFYPLSYLFKRFMPLARGLGWSLFWHIFLAGICMYFTARQFKLGKTASLMSGICYMFAPYLVSLVAPGHDGKIFVTSLFPLVILFIERGFEQRPLLNFSLLGLVLGAIILSPHAQMSYFTLWAAGLYTLFKLIMLYMDTRKVTPLIKPASFAGYAVVIALLISAIQFYPGYYYTSHFSPRADVKRGWDWATSWSMHAEEAANLVIPEFSGVSANRPGTAYWGKNAFKDNSEAVGIMTIFAGLIGLLCAKRREKWFFFGLSLFALTYGLGASTPLFQLYYLIPQVASLRAPSMIMVRFYFSFALLAGFGLQHVLAGKEEGQNQVKRFTWAVWGLPGLMLLLALLFTAAGRGMLDTWCSIFYSDAARTMIGQNVTKLDAAYYNLPGIRTGAWIGFLLTAVAAGSIWLYRSRSMAAGILLVVLALPVIDSMRFNGRFIDVVDPNEVFASNPLTDYLRAQPGHPRTLNLSQPKDDQLPYQHIDVMVGYHGNQLRWFDDLIGSIDLKNIGNPRLINLLGVKYLINETDGELPPDAFGDKPLSVAYTLGKTRLIQNDNAFPRVYLAGTFQVEPDRQKIYPQVLNSRENLRALVYLEEDPGLAIAEGGAADDSCWIVSRETDAVTVNVRTASNKLLVMTDTWFDAWQVTVDGQPARLLRAYGALRAVPVPAGTKEVRFEYYSQRYATGKLTTGLTSVFLLGIFGFYLVDHLRKRKR